MNSVKELREMYLSQFPEDGLSENEISEIEKKLGVVLPIDFKEIAQFFSGGNVGIIDFYDFRRENTLNIIDETIRLRTDINLSKNYIVIAEENESIVLLDLDNQPSVIWCDSVEITQIANRQFENEPNYWNDFSDLFLEMLEDEV